MTQAVPTERIERLILLLRGEEVLLGQQLAGRCGVPVKMDVTSPTGRDDAPIEARGPAIQTVGGRRRWRAAGVAFFEPPPP